MRSYAEYLTSLTVKTLNTIARDMGLKGYSKLRKAALVDFLASEIAALVEIAQDIDNSRFPSVLRSHTIQVAKFVATMPTTNEGRVAACLTFSAAPVKAPESVPAATDEADAQDSDPSEILYAYRAMRATFRTARGPVQVKLAQRLRTMGAQLRALGYNMRTV